MTKHGNILRRQLYSDPAWIILSFDQTHNVWAFVYCVCLFREAVIMPLILLTLLVGNLDLWSLQLAALSCI